MYNPLCEMSAPASKEYGMDTFLRKSHDPLADGNEDREEGRG